MAKKELQKLREGYVARKPKRVSKAKKKNPKVTIRDITRSHEIARRILNGK